MVFYLIEAVLERKLETQPDDPNFLQALRQIFRRISVQIAKTYLTVPAVEETSATCDTTQQRLRIRTLSLHVMDGVLCILIIQTTVVRFHYFGSPPAATSDPSGASPHSFLAELTFRTLCPDGKYRACKTRNHCYQAFAA